MEEEKKIEKYLPIGTVVMLKDGKKRVMITGFCCIGDKTEQQQMYDYTGCLYPEGYVSSNKFLLFNHDQIDKIYYLGFIDEEEKNFKANLKSVIEKLKNNNQQ